MGIVHKLKLVSTKNNLLSIVTANSCHCIAVLKYDHGVSIHIFFNFQMCLHTYKRFASKQQLELATQVNVTRLTIQSLLIHVVKSLLTN